MSRSSTREPRCKAAHHALRTDASRQVALSVHAAIEALKHGYPEQVARHPESALIDECSRPGCVGVEHDIHARIGYAISALERALTKLGSAPPMNLKRR